MRKPETVSIENKGYSTLTPSVRGATSNHSWYHNSPQLHTVQLHQVLQLVLLHK